MTALIETFVYLYLLGYLLNWRRQARESWLVDAAITFTQGLLLNYFILLVFRRISPSLEVGAVLAVVGAAVLARDLLNGRLRSMRVSPAALVLVACVAFLCFTRILLEPIWKGDALYIWFFQAKIMYVAGSLGTEAGWSHPSLYQLVPTYPKMVSSLAAEICYSHGLWNLYLPKTSLCILLTPALLWIFSFFEWSLSFPVLVFFLLLGMRDWLWSGYMDGFMGLFGSLCLLLLARYRYERRREDLLAAICAFGIAANVKNEGLLFAACATAVFVCFDLRSLRRSEAIRVGLAACAVIAPAILWKILVTRLGMHDDKFDYRAVSPFHRFMANMHNGKSFWFVSKSLYAVNHRVRDSSLVLLAGAIVGSWLGIKTPGDLKRSVLANIACAALYSAGLFVTYMILTREQVFVVMTSVDRTTFLTSSILNVSIYLIVRQVEFSPSTPLTATQGQ